MTNRTPHNFSESLEQAHEFHNGALEFLEEFKVPPNPTNYAIAYEYTARRNPALNDEIDVHLTRTGNLDGYILADLFERYFLQDHTDEIDGYIANLHEIFMNALDGVSGASEGVSEFGKVLEAQRGKLEGNPGIESVQSIVSTLMDATEQAHASNQQLQSHLEETQKETSQMREELEQLRKEAVTDGLTGLYNRKELNNRLDELLVKEYEPTKPLSVLMLDIDHFKKINDTLGHHIGDKLLKEVALRLQNNLRGKDIANRLDQGVVEHNLARLGGDEFTVLLHGITSPVGIGKIAQRLIETIEQPFFLEGKEHYISVSVGIAVFPGDGENSEDLLKHADLAMKKKKKNSGFYI